MDLTTQQWAVIAPLLPTPVKRKDGPGRPYRDPQDILNGILWILRTGAPWADLPSRYPSYQTCHRRFQEWVKSGVLEAILQALLRDLIKRGQIDLSECFVDGSYAGAKKGVLELVRQCGAKGPRSWYSQTAAVYLSPPGLTALHHMKSNMLNP